uniref:Uncharacterized protein n=1 Tax=Glycine max TaxID=3847 RepID=C6SXB5_SOYBN|nr:unknown [Glycine max]
MHSSFILGGFVINSTRTLSSAFSKALARACIRAFSPENDTTPPFTTLAECSTATAAHNIRWQIQFLGHCFALNGTGAIFTTFNENFASIRPLSFSYDACPTFTHLAECAALGHVQAQGFICFWDFPEIERLLLSCGSLGLHIL